MASSRNRLDRIRHAAAGIPIDPRQGAWANSDCAVGKCVELGGGVGVDPVGAPQLAITSDAVVT
jgi:hypothetical protein